MGIYIGCSGVGSGDGIGALWCCGGSGCGVVVVVVVHPIST